MRKIIYIFLLLLSYTAYSQSLSLFNVDASAFPVVKANFFAFDAEGKQITNLSPTDFMVTENGIPRTVTNVSCPSPKPIQNVSIAMSIDVSGSMQYSDVGEIPVELGKTTARELCKSVPMPPNEFALQTCDANALIIQDFTTNKAKLLSAIDPITAYGDNDFVEHLMNRLTGLLNIAKKGKYKRVAVLYTDAWWYALSDNELQACKDTCSKYNIQFYAVIYSRPEAEPNGIKKSLQLLADATGGILYDGIISSIIAKDIANRLQIQTQGGDPCSVKWVSGISCQSGVTNVTLNLPSLGLTANTNYQTPANSVAKLDIAPPSIKYKNAIPGIPKDSTITVTAKNADFNVTNITSTNPAYTVTPTSFFLGSGQSRNLTISYLPADSGYVFSQFTFENNNCPIRYYASGGYPGKKATIKTLKLIQPNGWEVFVAGMDTIITWEGVLPEQQVKLEYTTNGGREWITITDSAKGLSYKWKVPKVQSFHCFARATVNGPCEDYSNSMVLVPPGSFQMGNTGAYKGTSEEKPVHNVTLTKPLWVGKYEVTQELYESLMPNHSYTVAGDNIPVGGVFWAEAIEFCNKLSILQNLNPCYKGSGYSYSCDFEANGYRLLTEAEWEYVCKAGTTTDFYNGNLTNPDCEPLDANLDRIAWYCGNSNKQVHPVGQKEPNIFGIYDMLGNIFEWCWYGVPEYTSDSQIDPKGASNISPALRGGSFWVGADQSRSSKRSLCSPDRTGSYIGFRVCRKFE